MRRPSVRGSSLLDRIERPQPGIAGRREDDIRALADLGERELLALPRIVPGGVGDAHVVLDDANVWTDRAGTLLVTLLEAMDQTDVHAAQKPDRSGLGGPGRQESDEIGPLVLLENQRRDVGQLADAVDDGEVNVRIVLRDNLDDRRLGKADADDQIVAALGKRAQGWFDGSGRAGCDIAQHDAQGRLATALAVGPCAGLGTLDPGERGRVE